MFYFIASRIWMGNNETRLRNILLTGSICYIILHAFLYGNTSSETLARFRHYIYYMFAIDAILAGSYVWLFGTNNVDKNIDENDNDDNDNDSENEEKPNVIPRWPDKKSITKPGTTTIKKPNINGQKGSDSKEPIKLKGSKKPSASNTKPNGSMPELHRKLLELKAKNELAIKQDTSPFAKKDNGICSPSAPQCKNRSPNGGQIHGSTQPEEEISNEENQNNQNDGQQTKSRHSEASIPLYVEDLVDTDIPVYCPTN